LDVFLVVPVVPKVVVVVPMVVVVVVVVVVYNTGVWGIGFEVRKKPSLLWRVILANWLISVVPMEVMVVY
jgi:hypothetical protein